MTTTTTPHLVILLGAAFFAIILAHQLPSIVAARPLYVDQSGFDRNYVITWGADHVRRLDNGRTLQLSMDKSSGSGFSSRLKYDSGFFHLAIKIPKGDTAGVVTAFYLSSSTNNHDELDFEFLGNREGKPVTFQTNIFTNGHGNREQRLHLWFDPSDGFHDYRVLWNPYHIVFFVDDIPVRVFKNLTSRGVEYPSQAMQIYTSLWNGEDWATNGGKDKIKWRNDGSPFTCQFQGFNMVEGCSASNKNHSSTTCASSDLWWNAGLYKQDLSGEEAAKYERVKKRLTYDYCSDKQRFTGSTPPPPECGLLYL